MKKLSPAKRSQLIAVVFAILGVLTMIYMLLIQPQYEKNKAMATNIVNARVDLQKTKDLIGKRQTSNAELANTLLQLTQEENDVAVGDVYSWTYDTIRRFKAKYAVDIPNISPPSITEVDVLGAFPYKQVKVTLTGNAYYHDLGKFIADFENNFPHVRLVNLAIDTVAAAPGTVQEKLSFRMDVVALVKPNN